MNSINRINQLIKNLHNNSYKNININNNNNNNNNKHNYNIKKL